MTEDRSQSGDDTDNNYTYPDHGPECCIDGCSNCAPGLKHGFAPSEREGVACNDCWDDYNTHGHWPDEDCALCADTNHSEDSNAE